MTGKRDWYKDCQLLLLLLVLVIPLRLWLVHHTEVVARDGIGFISYALKLEKVPWKETLSRALKFEDLPWKETLLNNHQHPGYPLSIWAMSIPVRSFMGDNSAALQLSAQLASSLAAILLMFPMYFLGKLFFERRVAFWGTLLLQYLPASAHHFSDGISDPLFLLLTSCAFLFGVLALRRQGIFCYIASGLFCGLAYLTRPEAAMVLAAVLLALGLRQMIPLWKTTGRSAFAGALAMTLPALAVGSLYFGVTHKFTNKPSYEIILHERAELRQDLSPGVRYSEPRGFGMPRGPLFAAHNSTDASPLARLGQGVVIFGSELSQLFNYGGIVPLLLGLGWRLRQLCKRPDFLAPLLYLGMYCLLMPVMAYKIGYISDRHLLPMGVWGAYFAASGLCDLADRLRQWWPTAIVPRLKGGVSLVSLLMVLGPTGACLPRTLQSIHASGAGSRAAGLWLAQQLKSGDSVEDEHVWSKFYAGDLSQEPPKNAAPRGKSYIVLTRSKDPKVSEHLTKVEQEYRSKHGEIVFHWPPQTPEGQARIVIYALAHKTP